MAADPAAVAALADVLHALVREAPQRSNGQYTGRLTGSPDGEWALMVGPPGGAALGVANGTALLVVGDRQGRVLLLLPLPAEPFGRALRPLTALDDGSLAAWFRRTLADAWIDGMRAPIATTKAPLPGEGRGVDAA